MVPNHQPDDLPIWLGIIPHQDGLYAPRSPSFRQHKHTSLSCICLESAWKNIKMAHKWLTDSSYQNQTKTKGANETVLPKGSAAVVTELSAHIVGDVRWGFKEAVHRDLGPRRKEDKIRSRRHEYFIIQSRQKQKTKTIHWYQWNWVRWWYHMVPTNPGVFLPMSTSHFSNRPSFSAPFRRTLRRGSSSPGGGPYPKPGGGITCELQMLPSGKFSWTNCCVHKSIFYIHRITHMFLEYSLPL